MQGERIGIIKYKVGQIVKETFHCIIMINPPILTGEVVYVHPLGRYYTVEFDFGGNKLRESYTVRSDINPVELKRYKDWK